MTTSDDPYSRLDYRRLIAWPARIEREWPFLEEVLSSGPSRRVLDVGCGTGEHARFLAEHGFEVVGLDASEEMIEKAREGELPPGVRFVVGDLAEVESLVEGEFGGAICLGNMLPHVVDVESLARGFGGLRRRLAPGAPLLLQILNYDKIFATGQHALPLSFRDGESEGERIVFLRLMDPRPDGTVLFNPTTLRYRPGEEPAGRGDGDPQRAAAGLAAGRGGGGARRRRLPAPRPLRRHAAGGLRPGGVAGPGDRGAVRVPAARR